MGLGILEPRRRDAPVPGTEFLDASTENTFDAEYEGGLQLDSSGKKPIVLVPQPTGHRDDPLNWSLLFRDFVTFILCIVSILAATLGPILAATTVQLAFHFQESFTKIALLTGYHLLGVGVAGIFVVPTARVWGKRHLYVLGTILLFATSLWGGLAKTYTSFFWARIFQGVAVAPFEALANASIGDLYPVHQRGKRMAFTTFALFGGAFFTPVLVGKMSFEMSWRWPFYFLAIFSAAALPLVILFVPETAFRREGKYVKKSISTPSPAGREHGDEKKQVQVETPAVELGTERISDAEANAFFLRRRLPLFNGRKTDDKLWVLVLRPLVLLLHPTVLWGMFTQGSMIGWTVIIGTVIGAIFAVPPYMFNEVQTGYMYTGAFIGALLGFVLAGYIADWSAKFLAHRNNGIYEPEFRILLVIPQTIVGLVGLFGFGWASGNLQHYALCSFFFGLVVMAMTLGATASALYVVDAYKGIAIESLTALLLFKNFFSFGLSFRAFDWLNELGAWELHRNLALAQIGIAALSIPMYVYGKRLRAWWGHAQLLKKCGLELKHGSYNQVAAA